jgi:apolipoprotein N-acyltransferase
MLNSGPETSIASDKRLNRYMQNLKITIKNLVTSVAASAASGILLVLIYPEYDIGWLAWGAIVPLLVVLTRQKPLAGFVMAYVSGMIYCHGVFSWVFNVSGYSLLHHMLLIFFLSSYFGIFGWVFALIANRKGPTMALLSAPAIWCLSEYARCNLAFLALPMSIIAHSQYTFASVLQLASVTGVYGISFLVVTVNAGFAAVILRWSPLGENVSTTGVSMISRRNAGIVMGLASVLLAAVILHGQWVLNTPLEGDRIDVSIVQANITQEQKWNPRFRKAILKIYTDLTHTAAANGPALIIWPEAATPGSILGNRRLYKSVRQIAAATGSYLLLGSAQQRKNRPSGRKIWQYYNSAFLFPPETESAHQRYDKIRLMPFGEYLPMREVLPWSLLNIKERGAFHRGETFTIFETPVFRLGTTICWENLFPDLTRRFVLEGAQFIVNITNIAHFGKSSVPYQVASMNVFRAVENRVFVVRCTNTGVSCFIDPYGRIINRVQDQNGQDIFVRGVLTETIKLMHVRTLYTRYGDWFIGFCATIVLVTLAVPGDRRKL